MVLFWFAIAIIFLLMEFATFTFGFIFMTVGAIVNSFLIITKVIKDTDFTYQTLVMLSFGLVAFIFFFKSYKRLEKNSDTFKEDRDATVIDNELVKGIEGKIKWSGTIFNAILDKNSSLDKIAVGTTVCIKEFKGNIAIVDVVNK